MNKKHLFVINPVAGGIKGKLDELVREIHSIAESLTDPYEIYLTKGSMDAAEKIAAEAETADMIRVYACGGDGTLNECANGAANRKNVAITHYPGGTGNDFIRTFGHENIQKFRDLRALVGGTVRPLDLIDCSGRYGINICSVGIDARVAYDVHKFSSIPIIGGATGYVIALFTNIIKGVKQKYRLTHEGKTQEREITLVCACNGRFYGGGFNPIPEADPGDGIIEYLIIDGISRFRIAQIVLKYAKGRFREMGKIVTYIKGGSIDIESDKEFVVNIDGEVIRSDKIYFKVVPQGINFIFPNGMDV